MFLTQSCMNYSNSETHINLHVVYVNRPKDYTSSDFLLTKSIYSTQKTPPKLYGCNPVLQWFEISLYEIRKHCTHELSADFTGFSLQG